MNVHLCLIGTIRLFIARCTSCPNRLCSNYSHITVGILAFNLIVHRLCSALFGFTQSTILYHRKA